MVFCASDAFLSLSPFARSVPMKYCSARHITADVSEFTVFNEPLFPASAPVWPSCCTCTLSALFCDSCWCCSCCTRSSALALLKDFRVASSPRPTRLKFSGFGCSNGLCVRPACGVLNIGPSGVPPKARFLRDPFCSRSAKSPESVRKPFLKPPNGCDAAGTAEKWSRPAEHSDKLAKEEEVLNARFSGLVEALPSLPAEAQPSMRVASDEDCGGDGCDSIETCFWCAPAAESRCCC